jgi:cellulose synthase/poly-beta-1,6-N-acetylglucosamine synthase-like glycosyltransferase
MDFVSLTNYIIAFFSLFVANVFILLYLRHRDNYLKTPPKTDWTPSVSIVLPAYNEGVYLEHSLKTLLSLDYPKDKLEIIVVDDGSTDNTYEIAKKFEGGRIKVFTKKNGGKGSALNFGIKEAKGELIATMDADSYLTKNALYELLPFFNEPRVMAVTPAVKIKSDGAPLKELQRVEYLMILFSRKLLSLIDSVPVTPGPFSIFRAEVFDKVGLFDEHNLVEDQEIALRIQSHNYKIRSSMTADIYTEPPDNIPDLLKQRVRWQRGGIRNFWKYRFMINPKYGDFGMYFVPLNFAGLTALFVLLGLMIHSIFTTPYYVQYMWTEIFGMSIGLYTFVGAFVLITSVIFTFLSVHSFKGERIGIHYMLMFIIFYWYLMISYNILFLLKELKRESYSW